MEGRRLRKVRIYLVCRQVSVYRLLSVVYAIVFEHAVRLHCVTYVPITLCRVGLHVFRLAHSTEVNNDSLVAISSECVPVWVPTTQPYTAGCASC